MSFAEHTLAPGAHLSWRTVPGSAGVETTIKKEISVAGLLLEFVGFDMVEKNTRPTQPTVHVTKQKPCATDSRHPVWHAPPLR